MNGIGAHREIFTARPHMLDTQGSARSLARTFLANIPGILHGPRRFLGLAPGRRGMATQLPNPRQHGVPALVLAPAWDDDDEDRLNSGLYDLDVDELSGLVLALASAALAGVWGRRRDQRLL